MAHSPEKKAAVIVDLAAGASLTDVCKRHGIARQTAISWKKEIGLAGNSKEDHLDQDFGPSNNADEALLRAVQETLIQRVSAPGRILKHISNPEFIDSKTEHVALLLESAAREANGALDAARLIHELRASDHKALPAAS